MNRLDGAFKKGKAFISFITAGDPSLEKTADFIKIMAGAGADIIELGIPFSDPIAEGPVIQRSSMRALEGGATPDKIFDTVEKARRDVSVPIVLLSYINPMFNYGYDRFFARCALCGADGVIIPDMPYEERGEVADFARKHGIYVISMVAPTSDKRTGMIAMGAEGFIYCVSSMGVTGVRSEINTDLRSIINVIRGASDVPVAVGFGISEPRQAEEIAGYADGVIVGSAIVKIIEAHGENAGEHIAKYVKEMKKAVLKGGA